VVATLVVFINAHLAFNNLNKVAVVAAHTKAKWLYPATHHTELSPEGANKYRPFHLVESEVKASLKKLMQEPPASPPMVGGALTLALAYINRTLQDFEDVNNQSGIYSTQATDGMRQTREGPQSRILMVSVSEDASAQYIPIMNCIFAAQRNGISIDVCKLAGGTAFLKQAADATSGIYTELDEPKGLLQYLMVCLVILTWCMLTIQTSFLPDATSRKSLILPAQENVDFRAACFCHQRVVDIGFVCSICLSSMSFYVTGISTNIYSFLFSAGRFDMSYMSNEAHASKLRCPTSSGSSEEKEKEATRRLEVSSFSFAL
jgi:transcription initiation factor TFIIH subunit 3